MKIFRLLLAAAPAFAAIPVNALDRVLPTPRIKDNGDIRLSDDLKIGRYQGGKFIWQPDTVEIQGAGSTGDISKMSVTPSASAPVGSLGRMIGSPNGLATLDVGGLLPGVQTPNPMQIVGAKHTFSMVPYAGTPVTTMTAFGLKGPSLHENQRDFLASLSQKCVTGATNGTPSSPNLGCATLYLDQEAAAGGISAWGFNANIFVQPGYFAAGGKSVIGAEINLNYGFSGGSDTSKTISASDTDFGPADGDPSGVYPNGVGLPITAIGGKKWTAAITLSTDGQREFIRGLSASGGSITNCLVCDYNSGATSVIDIRGAHQYGLDTSKMTGGPAVRLANTQYIAARNFANTADIIIAQIDSSNRLILFENTASITAMKSISPQTDQSAAIGGSGLRFNGVWGQIFYPGSYTKATLPGGQPVGATTYCSNCLKPGESAGAGTGMLVTFTNGQWYTTAGTASAN